MLRNVFLGNFQNNGIKRYVLFESGVFWAIILLALWSYPRDHHYSIMTHTFSFLGSFEAKHNPQYWWVFSIAMMFWALANVPLILYMRRRFALISPKGAAVGAALFLLGSAGIAGVALFPDARGAVIGDWEWTEIHEKAALTVAAGFILGVVWHGILLLMDRFRPQETPFNHRRLQWPYLFWAVVFVVSAYHLIRWEYLYAARKAAALAAGTSIGSSWSEAMNTRYAFPLWEHILIYTLFIFLMWLALTLPRTLPARTPGKSPQ